MMTESTRHPLTAPPREVWFDQSLSPSSPLLNLAGGFHIEAPLDVSRFRRAVREMMLRNDALHLRIGEQGGEPYQIFSFPDGDVCPFVDLSAEDRPDEMMRSHLGQECARPFCRRLKHRFLLRLPAQACFFPDAGI